MSESFRIRVDGIRFAAAHFATFGGGCEPLHGHSYEVTADVEGPLAEDAWVVDFVAVKSLLRSICRELDHRFLLQRESRLLVIEDGDMAWQVRTPAGTQYTLPKTDVAALPIDNTTAERLAQWLNGRLWLALGERGEKTLTAITIGVWEGPGQRAAHRQENCR